MKEIESYGEWMELVGREKQLLLFVKTNNCSVCDGLFPQVELLEADHSFPFYKVNAAEVPEITGQLALFTAPVVLLFNEGKETARFARFVQMEQLKKRMVELTEWGNGYA